MDDSVMQQHLVHYKQATESAREELAAVQIKCQSLQSQVIIPFYYSLYNQKGYIFK